ncbi:MAG: two pore domain potassium channel family protein [bacterium]|nr:two pore domain potassium channel family protein [bacterium]
MKLRRVFSPPSYGFSGLLATLVVFLFLLWPAVGGVPGLRRVMLIAFTAVFLAAVYAISNERRLLSWTLALGALGLVSTWLSHFIPEAGLGLAKSVLTTAFLGYIGLVILREVLADGEVTRERILGSICVYLLIGLCWSAIYDILYTLDAGAFRFPAGSEPSALAAPDGHFELVYYSFVTLTTLGYGDITPVSSVARGLTTLEAVTGQLYIAVLVARLVGLYVAHSMSGAQK